MSRRTYTGANAENRAVRNLDDLADFDDYRSEILPKLRAAVASGKSAEDISKIAAAAAAARIATMAIAERDPMRALAAAREVLDRAHGKAAQKTEVHAKFDKLSDDELDALLASELAKTKEADVEPSGETSPH